MYPERNRRPRWNRLYLIVLPAVGGLVLENDLHLTPTGHKLVLVLIVGVVYGWIGQWVGANAAALENLGAEKCQEQSHNPVLFGTREFPTRVQARFREVMSFYRHEAPPE